MAIAIVQSTFSTVAGTPKSISFAATVTSGNAVVAVFIQDGNVTLTSITDDKGSAYTVDISVYSANTARRTYIVSRLNVTNAPITVTAPEGSTLTAIYELSGVATSAALDVSTSAENAFGTAFATSITTAANNEFGIAALNDSGAAVAFTGSSAWTLGTNNNDRWIYTKTLATAGSQAFNGTFGSNTIGAVAFATYKEAVAAVPSVNRICMMN